jgi:ankyrin repeat protein
MQEYGKMTQLHFAAENGRKDVMLLLINKYHMDIEARDQV